MSLKTDIELENQKQYLEGISTITSCLTESVSILSKSLTGHFMSTSSSYVRTNASMNSQPDSYILKPQLIQI